MPTFSLVGRGGGQVVRLLAFYSDDQSSNPSNAFSFSVEFVFEKNENKPKEAGVGPFKKQSAWFDHFLFILLIPTLKAIMGTQVGCECPRLERN